MAQHVVTLYDEIHRIFFLNENLSNDLTYTQVRIGYDAKGHYLFLLGPQKIMIRLKNVKIPPSTGPDYESIFKDISKKFSSEIKALL